MRLRLCRFAWLAMASAVILSLTVGAALAHEGRPVGDYRFIVGWLDEPTYEGSRNAVSVRVNKIVDGSDHDNTSDHHGEEDQDGRSEGTRASTGETGMSGEDHHGAGGGHDGPVEATSAMSVDLETAIDPLSGLNVRIEPTGFTFSPQNVNLERVDGEGHAHIYVDGIKVSRVYGPWFHLDGLEPGEREIEIRLNANDHSEYPWNDEAVKASMHVAAPEAADGMHHEGTTTTPADAEMSVSIMVEADPLGGANLFITGTTGFTLAPQNAGADHIAGEGHAYVYVNGVKVSRIYGNAFQLGKMTEGMNEVRLTLNANDYSAYTWDGEVVQAIATIEIADGMGGVGYGTAAEASEDMESRSNDSHHGGDGEQGGAGHPDSVRLPVPQGMAKPLASLLAQDGEGVAPVEGLEGSIRVEVRHVASNETRILDVEAVANDPGHYIAGLVPTAPGVYEFRVFGDLEGTAVDETFVSAGAGGAFHDVRTTAELQFPVVLPEVREIESGVRGALQTAQQAQDAALAAQDNQGSNLLPIIALIVGIVGGVLGTAGIYFGLRTRQT